jgi:signal transduction histidine kinase
MDPEEVPVAPERVRQLTRLSRAFTDARSLEEILKLAVDQAASLLGSERVVLMLADEAGLLHVRAAHGVEADAVEQFRCRATESLVSRLRALLGSHLSEGFVGVPLVTRGRVVGLLATVRADGGSPTREDEWLLSALADQVAAPLENARLATQLESSALLAENVRLYESERAARITAEAAQRDAEAARDAAVQADMSKTAFLAAMSHELRTPLNAIAGYVEILEMGLRGPVTPEQAYDLNRIKASQSHLLSLISDVLDYARLGAGQTELQIADIDLVAVLRETEAMVMPQLLAKGLDYAFNPGTERLIVRADKQRLQQIVLNLLTNAIKFTEAGGQISMDCGAVGDAAGDGTARFARVRVKDTGPGIPHDRIASIWQPFVQLGRKLSRPTEGVGLGLAISGDLARQLGGELSVVSEIDVGSIFTLTLPIARG